LKRYSSQIVPVRVRSLFISLAVLVSMLASSWLMPALAFAEEAHQAAEAAEEGGGGIGIELLLPDLGEFIPMMISFAIILFILARFGWPVIIDMLNQRVETIKGNLEQAEASRIETAQLLEQQRAELAEARNQAARIIADARAAAEANRAEIEAQAAQQAEAMLANARNVIEHEKYLAMLELRKTVADFSVALTSRLIGSDLNENEHRQIIERYVAQAGSFDVD